MPTKNAPESLEVGSKSPNLGATRMRPFWALAGGATTSAFFGAGAAVVAGGAATWVGGAGAAGVAGAVWASAAAGRSMPRMSVVFMVFSLD